MRRGWVLKYEVMFYAGKERIVIQRYYQIGWFKFLRSWIWLFLDEADRLADFIKENKNVQ